MKSFNLNNKTFYYKGNIDLLESNQKRIGVVGTRKPSTESIAFTEQKVSELSKDNIIVSGLALGTDKIAHQTCLDNGGLTIAVLPCGLDKIYPLMHTKLANEIIQNDGLLISEYEPKVKPNRKRFIERDKIIAKLSDELLVPQCNFKSGTMHTVNFTKELNKKIYVQNKDYSGNISILKTYEKSYPL